MYDIHAFEISTKTPSLKQLNKRSQGDIRSSLPWASLLPLHWIHRYLPQGT